MSGCLSVNQSGSSGVQAERKDSLLPMERRGVCMHGKPGRSCMLRRSWKVEDAQAVIVHLAPKATFREARASVTH